MLYGINLVTLCLFLVRAVPCRVQKESLFVLLDIY